MADSDPDRAAATPVARLGALNLEAFERGASYVRREAEVARRVGLTQLGATYLEVPPGKAAWPFHVHHVVDEMFVILEGTGRYRFGDTVHQIEAGDVLAAPRGGPELAHKLTNTGTATLKYLVISSKGDADVCEYPDSGKFAVGTRFGFAGPEFGYVGRADEPADYWDGEPDSAL